MQQLPSSGQRSAPASSFPSAESEWRALVKAAPEACRTAVAIQVEAHARSLADSFYEGMMAYPAAAVFLDHSTVHKRLHGSMMRWLTAIYAHPEPDDVHIAALVAMQRHVGDVHARIQLPLHLVARGARMLKQALFKRLSQAIEDVYLRAQAVLYTGQVMDLALELMSTGYLRNAEKVVRTDEAYRLFSLGQNISVEREKQRSALLEWGQVILFQLYRAPRPGALPRLSSSDFGLWFNHKAQPMFEGAPELEQIGDLIDRVDSALLPLLSAATEFQSGDLLSELEGELQTLKFLLSALFERHLELENGRDSLTRLLNRRFLPSVMNREIRMANKGASSFALLLLDIDHFKAVNDLYGHDAGDQVLQQAAALILNAVRSVDFVFRYGGEEIIVMLVEVSVTDAMAIAEKIRSKFESTEFLLSEGRRLNMTVSIGVAAHDGHPDHQYLIGLADKAMYQAKQSGRNQVQMAIPG